MNLVVPLWVRITERFEQVWSWHIRSRRWSAGPVHKRAWRVHHRVALRRPAHKVEDAGANAPDKPPRERRGGIAPRQLPGGSYYQLSRNRFDSSSSSRRSSPVRLSIPCCEILSS